MIKTMEIVMQTLTKKVKDDLVSEVINVLGQFKDNIQILKDKNLEFDPYFYDRQDKLHKIVDKMDKDLSKLTSFKDFEIKMDKLEKVLEEKYAN